MVWLSTVTPATGYLSGYQFTLWGRELLRLPPGFHLIQVHSGSGWLTATGADQTLSIGAIQVVRVTQSGGSMTRLGEMPLRVTVVPWRSRQVPVVLGEPQRVEQQVESIDWWHRCWEWICHRPAAPLCWKTYDSHGIPTWHVHDPQTQTVMTLADPVEKA